MVIFNSKPYATNFAVVDNVIVEIFATCSIEQFFDRFEKGEDISNVVIKTYKTDPMDPILQQFKERPNDEDVRQYLFESDLNYFSIRDRASCMMIPNIMNRFEANGRSINEYKRDCLVERIRERKDDYRSKHSDPENDSRILSFYGAGHVEDGRYDEVERDDEIVKAQVKDALGIAPDDDRTDVPLDQRIKDGAVEKRFMWEMDNVSSMFFPQLPSVEEKRFFDSLNANEQRELINSLFVPHFAVWLARVYKEAYPEKPITLSLIRHLENTLLYSRNQESRFTKDDVLSAINDMNYEVTQDRDIGVMDAKFKAAFRGRSPRILNDIIRAYRMLNGIDSMTALTEAQQDELVKLFNANSIKLAARTENINLIALALMEDLSSIKKSHLDIFKTYLPTRMIHDGESENIRIKGRLSVENCYNNIKEFCDWYHKTGKKVNDKALRDVLKVYKFIPKDVFKPDLTGKQITDLIDNKKALEDKGNYERQYNYSFSDNQLAIRGREIEVVSGRYRMYMLPATDLRNYTVGYDTQCCQHWGGAGQTCVWKLTTDPFAGVVVVENKDTGDVLAQSFVWTDEARDTFVFDNIEFANDNGRVANLYSGIIAKYVSVLPYENVHMGTGYTEGIYNTWGKKVTRATFAQMPNTVDPDHSHIYSDYHAASGSVARVFKSKGNVLIPNGKGIVSYKEIIPSDYDRMTGKDNPLRFFLNRTDLTLEQKIDLCDQIANNPSDELIDEMVRSQPSVVATGLFTRIPEETQHHLVESGEIDLLEFIPNPTHEVMQAYLERYPSKLGELARRVDVPRELIVSCLQRDGRYIFSYPNADYELYRIAVSQNGTAIEFVPEQLLSEELITCAVTATPDLIGSFPDVSDEIKECAIRSDPMCIALIENPSEELQVIAASLKPQSLLGVMNPCEHAMMAAVNTNWRSLRVFARKLEPDFVRSVVEQHQTEIDHVLSSRVLENIDR